MSKLHTACDATDAYKRTPFAQWMFHIRLALNLWFHVSSDVAASAHWQTSIEINIHGADE